MKFTIYGERCSGTNYLAKLMYDNFEVEYVLLPDSINGAKHWFGNEKNIESIRNSKDCIVFCIVRNPIDWIMSFYNTPHQQAPERITDLMTFVSTEFYSTLQSTGEELELRRYKDIFDMRSVKSRFLYLNMPSITPNSYFIRYEDLKHAPHIVLAEIENKFHLIPKQTPYIIEKRRVLPQAFELTPYMPLQTTGSNKFKTDDVLPKENYIIEDVLIKNVIQRQLDFGTEKLIGYEWESIISRLQI